MRGLRQQASAPPHTFEADITASEEPPHRAAAARDPAFAHRRDDLVQRKVWLVNNQTQEKLRVLLQRRGAAAAWLCRNAGGLVKRCTQITTTLG